MDKLERMTETHTDLTRRYFLGLGTAGVAGFTAMRALGRGDRRTSGTRRGRRGTGVSDARRGLHDLWPRQAPPPYELPPEKLREVGLHPDTWQLEIVPDPRQQRRGREPR